MLLEEQKKWVHASFFRFSSNFAQKIAIIGGENVQRPAKAFINFYAVRKLLFSQLAMIGFYSNLR